jgi:hypothetical protein
MSLPLRWIHLGTRLTYDPGLSHGSIEFVSASLRIRIPLLLLSESQILKFLFRSYGSLPPLNIESIFGVSRLDSHYPVSTVQIFPKLYYTSLYDTSKHTSSTS